MRINRRWLLGVAGVALTVLTACGGERSPDALGDQPPRPFAAPLSCREYSRAAMNPDDTEAEKAAAFTRGEWELLVRGDGLVVDATKSEAKVQALQGDTVKLCNILWMDAKSAIAQTYKANNKRYWP